MLKMTRHIKISAKAGVLGEYCLNPPMTASKASPGVLTKSDFHNKHLANPTTYDTKTAP